MKYNDDGTIKEFIVKAVNTNIKNEPSASQEDTYSCDYINKLHTYSTEEQIIGTYADGKPIYSKTIIGNSSSISTQLLTLVDTLVDIKGTAYISGAWRIFPFYLISNNKEYRADVSVVNNNVYMKLVEAGVDITTDIKITLEYTKTTDIATIDVISNEE